MNYSREIYDAIEADFNKPEHSGKTKLSRSIRLDNKIRLIYFVDKEEGIHEVGVKLEQNYSSEELNMLPKWNGLRISVEHMLDYEEVAYDCIILQQLENYEAYIFEIIVDDIVEKLNILKSPELITNTLSIVLFKWKQFFLIQPEIKMSDIKQQGLYGEMLALEQLIDKFEEKAVFWWTGFNMETHDFYVNTNAIEVKTSCVKGPHNITINNEYQLDTTDVNGDLFLKFFALRNSISDGENLPEIINRLCKKIIEHVVALEEFKSKLFKYGYISDYPELYELKFSKRDERNYIVTNKFPKIAKRDLHPGVGSVTYQVSLGSCEPHRIDGETILDSIVGC